LHKDRNSVFISMSQERWDKIFGKKKDDKEVRDAQGGRDGSKRSD
jgi:hypothetical protein